MRLTFEARRVHWCSRNIQCPSPEYWVEPTMKDIFNWIRTIAINLSRRLTFQKNFSMVLLNVIRVKGCSLWVRSIGFKDGYEHHSRIKNKLGLNLSRIKACIMAEVSWIIVLTESETGGNKKGQSYWQSYWQSYEFKLYIYTNLTLE